MVQWQNDWENGLANGTALTPANSAYASNDAVSQVDVVGASSSVTVDTTSGRMRSGSRSIRCTADSTVDDEGPPATSGFGPTGGAQAIRDAAGPQTVPAFTGTAGVDFVAITNAMTQATIQGHVNNPMTAFPNLTAAGRLRFQWASGTYRWTSVFTFGVANQEHRLAPLTTIKGSAVEAAWSPGAGADLGKWFTTNAQTQNFDSRDTTTNVVDNPLAGSQLEAYYKNGVLLYPVASKAALTGTNTVFFDNANNIAWINFDPSTLTIEKLTFFEVGNKVTASNVQIKGGRWLHFGFASLRWDGINAANETVTPNGGLVQDAELAYSRMGQPLDGFGNGSISPPNDPRIQGLTVRRCWLHHGANYNYLFTHIDDLVIEDCRMEFGNNMHFGDRQNAQYAEGDDKVLWSARTIIRRNWVTDADGAGFWPDTDNNDMLIQDNVFENNRAAGIHHEANQTGIVERNYFGGNSIQTNLPAPYTALGDWGYRGGGIFLSSSDGIEIRYNEFRENFYLALYMRGDAGRRYALKNTWFHHNLVYHKDSADNFEFAISYRDSANANAITPDPDSYLDSPYRADANNKFDFNEYHVLAAGRTQDGTDQWFFAPSGTKKTFALWQNGMANLQNPSGVAVGAPASYFDPNSTFIEDGPWTFGGTPPPSGQTVPGADKLARMRSRLATAQANSTHRFGVWLPTGQRRAFKLASFRDQSDREVASLHVTQKGFLQMRDRHHTAINTGTVQLPQNQPFRVEAKVSISPTALASNVFETKVFLDGLDTLPVQTRTVNGADITVDHKVQDVWLGICSPVAKPYSINIDQWKWQDGTTYVGPPTGGTGAEVFHAESQDPDGAGGMNAYAIDPIDPLVHYMPTDVGSILTSRNHGETWLQHKRGIYLQDPGRKTATVGAFPDPRTPTGSSVVFVGHGTQGGTDPALHRSFDKAITWELATTQIAWHSQSPTGTSGLPHLPRQCGQLLDLDWQTPGASGKGTFYGGSFRDGVARSTDFGDTVSWIAMTPNSGAATGYWFIRHLMCDPGNPSTVLVGVYDVGGGVGGLYALRNARTGNPTPELLWRGTACEDGLVLDDTFYGAFGGNGIWRSVRPFTSGAFINGIAPTNGPIWNAIGGRILQDGKHMVVIACHDPVLVTSAGVYTTTNSGLYSGIYRCLDAKAASPVWEYVSNPNTDFNPNYIDNGRPFWRYFDQSSSRPGKGGADFVTIDYDAANDSWIAVGAGGIPWISHDGAQTWQAAGHGVVIGSTQNVAVDTSGVHPGGAIQGNQDHKTFCTVDGGNTWFVSKPNHGGSTATAVHCDFQGEWWVGNSYADVTDPGNDGELFRSVNNQNPPAWVSQNEPTGGRISAITSGLLANGTTKRILYVIEGGGIRFLDLPGGFGSSSLTGADIQLDMPAQHMIPLIWPNQSTSAFVFAYFPLGGARAGFYRSGDRGATWTQLWNDTSSSGIENVGWICAFDPNTVYLANGTGLHRIRNATTTTGTNITNGTNRDDITGFSNVGSICFDPQGRLYIHRIPQAGRYAQLHRVQAPVPTSGTTLTTDDLLDPATMAFDTLGQGIFWNVKGMAADGTRIYGALHGASVGRLQGS